MYVSIESVCEKIGCLWMTWFSMSLLNLPFCCSAPFPKTAIWRRAPVAQSPNHLGSWHGRIARPTSAWQVCSSHSQAGHTEHGGKLRYPHVLWCMVYALGGLLGLSQSDKLQAMDMSCVSQWNSAFEMRDPTAETILVPPCSTRTGAWNTHPYHLRGDHTQTQRSRNGLFVLSAFQFFITASRTKARSPCSSEGNWVITWDALGCFFNVAVPSQGIITIMKR